MRIYFYSPVAFEPWDWRNSVEKGIGGSETSHVEMAWRLARRGHEVKTYAPVPDDCPGEWRGTTWEPLANADFSQPGVWVLYRCPSTVDEFMLRSPKTHPVWLLFQDWTYPDLTPARIARCQRLITLCQSHGRDLRRAYPTGADRIWITSNGLKLDLLEDVELEAAHADTRDPHKIMFASSPDRGLLHVLRSVERAREYVPTLHVHAFYGYDNLDKLLERMAGTHQFARDKADVLRYADQPWVHLRGRVDQRTLYREWLSSGLWVYQTNFNETSCITCMEAQACGAVPVFNPVYALGENVRHGIAIEGDAWNDPLTKARFAVEIARASDPAFQQAIRPGMMADARVRYDWENFVTQWEGAAAEDLDTAHTIRVSSQAPPAPLLSVVTPTIRLEGLDVVWDCLQRQDYRNWEWLISVPEQLHTALALWARDKDRVRVSIEPTERADFYQLNKAWNDLALRAHGQAIVSVTDWLWFADDVLHKLAQRYMAFGDHAIISVPTSHVAADQTAEYATAPITWVDYRLLRAPDCSDLPELDPSAMELNLTMVPRKTFLNVGGMDESYDQVAGMSEKELAYRMKASGVALLLDKRLQARAIEHAKEWPDWDAKVKLAQAKLDADSTSIMNGSKKRGSLAEVTA